MLSIRSCAGLVLGFTGVVFFSVSPGMAANLSDGVSTLSVEDIRSDLAFAPSELRTKMSREQMMRYVTNLMVDRRLADAAEKAGLGSDERVRAELEKVRRDVLIKAYIGAEMAKAAKVLPDLQVIAKERYDANMATYAQPEAIRVAHILFKVNPDDPDRTDAKVKDAAERVLEKLKAGADFEAMAKDQSEDTGSARNGGMLPGWMNKGRLVPQFEAAAYVLKPNEISGLVKSRFGYHIIKLIEHRNASFKPFEEVRGQILSSIQDEILAQKRQEFVNQFAGKQEIVIDDAILDALRKP